MTLCCCGEFDNKVAIRKCGGIAPTAAKGSGKCFFQMERLKPLPDTELSEYVVNLLHKHNVKTVCDLVDTDVLKISKITNLSFSQVLELKRAVRKKYTPQGTLLSAVYSELKKNWVLYGSGIQGLDALLGEESLASGRVWEVCGMAGVGKTQFCLTLVLNFVSKWERQALYIDTKQDFSGRRIRAMLRSRQVDTALCGNIMEQIKVERTLSPIGVLHILEQLLQQLEARNADAMNIKFVVVDSVPAVWLLLHDGSSRPTCNCYLTKLAQMVHRLARKHFIAFLLVNVSLPMEEKPARTGLKENVEELGEDSVEDDMPSQSNAATSPDEVQMRPALGRYWKGVPRLRLSMELPGEDVADYSQRTLRVIQSCYSATGISCQARITDSGVI